MIPGRAAWLSRVPEILRDLENRWYLRLGAPYQNASCAWVAPVTLTNGTLAVLKLGMPHMDGERERAAVLERRSDRIFLDADDALGAMLPEHCEPGTMLRCRNPSTIW